MLLLNDLVLERAFWIRCFSASLDSFVDFARLGLPDDIGRGGGVTLTASGCDGDLPRDLLLSEIVDAIEALSAASSLLCSCLKNAHIFQVWCFGGRLQRV